MWETSDTAPFVGQMNKDVVLLLTGTVNVGQTPNVLRASASERLDDYLASIQRWLNQGSFSKILFVENSDFDANEIRRNLVINHNKIELEILTYNGSDYDPKLGKSYGEKEIIKYAFEHSRLLAGASGVVKVNGRYFVPKLSEVIKTLPESVDICGDLRPCFKFSDSRISYWSAFFYLRFLKSELDRVDERIGFYFEHALATAILRAVSERLRFQLMRPLLIVGYSGSLNQLYERSFKRRLSDWWKFCCRRLLYALILRPAFIK